ncbi:MAG: hypothetical protein KH846_05835 [Leptotrichia wadei]|jgi:hypothetical protein|uniref:hypothetical protein n=1 Tax=Leptotrichia wadei TaxID=157687 RepID=UPI0026EF9D4F|nr:hypothetical protein [Leptotrichia wadei]MBS6019705.1 hypothetical protein [Leptotrichia wadei]
MEKEINELIKFNDNLIEKIKKYEKNLLFVKVLNDREIEKKVKILLYLQSTINQSIQIGNYKRAFKFILLLEYIVKQLPEINKQIIRKISEKII